MCIYIYIYIANKVRGLRPSTKLSPSESRTSRKVFLHLRSFKVVIYIYICIERERELLYIYIIRSSFIPEFRDVAFEDEVYDNNTFYHRTSTMIIIIVNDRIT